MRLRTTSLVAVALALGVAAVLSVMGAGIGQLGTHLPGFYNDDAANGIYLHHQVHAALAAGRFDLSDPSQFHPFGYNPLHTNGGNVLEMLLSGLARLVLPWPTWMGVGGLLWIPLNMLAFLPLGRRIFDDDRVVLAGAMGFGLMPVGLAQLAAGRWTQLALVGLPLVVWGLVQIVEHGGRRAQLITAGAWALTGLGYWFNALFVALLLPVFLVLAPTGRSRIAITRDMAIAGVGALILVSPFLLVVFAPALGGGAMPGAHVQPTEMNPVFPDALQLLGGQGISTQDWLPWVMLPGLVLCGFLGRRRWLWLGLVGVCVVFALGPAQSLDGQVWRMPYWPVWRFVPGVARMFHPDRWLLIGGLFLAIASAEGLGRLKPRYSLLIPVGILLQLHLGDRLPLSTWSPQTPAHWQFLAEQPGDAAVIVVPIMHSQLAGAYQHLHGRPLLGGMIEDQPWATPPQWRGYIEDDALLRSLRGISYGRATRVDASDTAQLKGDGFGYVVLDQASWSRARRGSEVDPYTALEAGLGPALYRSEAGAVWALPVTKQANPG